MKPSSSKSILAVVFILSGACGLIYQIVWFKYLALAVGNTTYAQMIVLSTFLGGLALGNHFLGKLADRTANPVRLYAILELVIGAYCLFYPWMNQVTAEAFRSVMISTNLYGTAVGFTLLRFLLSAVLLLLPTIAMGGTLPSLSRFFIRADDTADSDTGTLYFLNSFGAIIGVYFAGFQLIEAFGLPATMFIAATINLLVGLVAFVLSSKTSVPVTGATQKRPVDGSDRQLPEKKILRIAITVAGISGFAALLYEMLWVRLLVNMIGSSTYSFSLMLGAFITGITAGSLLISRSLFGRMNKLHLLVLCQGGVALGTIAVLPAYSVLPYYLWKLSAIFDVSGGTFGIFLALEYGVCFLLMLIPTLFMGMSLPLVVGIVCGDKEKIGTAVGTVFSVNTAGTVAGVIITGSLLIPVLGVQQSFAVGICLNLLAALMVFFAIRGKSGASRAVVLALAILTALLPTVVLPRWDLNLISSGAYRRFSEKPPEDFAAFMKPLESRRVLFYKEGVNASVAVIGYPENGGLRVLSINGKPDASNGDDMPTQLLLAHIPLCLHANPKSVFVIGFGSGATVNAVLAHPVDSVRCLEITREVLDAAPYFDDINAHCLSDSRLNVTIDDAHTYLTLVPRTYDVIISEPSNPWVAGIANLFSQEYFDLCRQRLRPGGIMAQWFHTYETDDEIVHLVLNTFQSVFPHCQVWTPTVGDIILLGSETEIPLDTPRIEALFNREAVRASLDRLSIRTPFALLSIQSMTGEGVYCATNEAFVNSEMHPRLEFLAPKSYFFRKMSTVIEQADQRANLPNDQLLVKRLLGRRPPRRDELFDALAFFAYRAKIARVTYALSRYALDRWGEDFTARYSAIRSAEVLGLRTGLTRDLRELYRLHQDSTFLAADIIDNEWSEIRSARSFLGCFPVTPVTQALAAISGNRSESDPETLLRFAELYFQNGELNAADSVCARLLSMVPAKQTSGRPDWMGRTLYIRATISLYRGDLQRAAVLFKTLVDISPHDALTREVARRVEWRLHLFEGSGAQ